VLATLLLGLAALWLTWGALRRHLFERKVAKAQTQFDRRRDEVQEEFFSAAASSGKPRGLKWTECDFHDGVLFAVDRTSRELYALVGATIRFAAIEGGGMEQVDDRRSHRIQLGAA